MLLLISIEQANLLISGLNALPASSAKDELLEKMNTEIGWAIQREAEKAKGELSPSQIDVLFNAMVDYVVNKKPRDLVPAHNGEWFSVIHGKMNWNWRNRLEPLNELAKKLGIGDECFNTADFKLNQIIERVKRNAEVKKVKQNTKPT